MPAVRAARLIVPLMRGVLLLMLAVATLTTIRVTILVKAAPPIVPHQREALPSTHVTSLPAIIKAVIIVRLVRHIVAPVLAAPVSINVAAKLIII